MSGASIPSWARVGAKVVCVDDKMREPFTAGRFATPSSVGLTAGNIYTLRWVGQHSKLGVTYFGVRLVGIKNGTDDTAFYADRFRPLVDDQAEERDLAMFRGLIDQRQRADA